MDFVTKLNMWALKKKNHKLRHFIAKFIWVEKVLFFQADLLKWHSPKLPRMRLQVSFSIGHESDVREIVSDPHLNAQSDRSYYLEKFHAGHKILLARHKGQIVFYLWVVQDRKSLMDKFLQLEAQQIAIERGFTRKEFRGHGIFPYALVYFMTQANKQLGATNCLTEIATHNNPMLRTIKKCGFQPIDSYYYWVQTPFKHYAVAVGSLAPQITKKN